MLRPLFFLFFLLIYSSLSFSQHLTYRNYTYTDGLPVKSISSLLVDAGGNVYLGSQNNSISVFNGDRFVEFSHPYSKRSGAIVSILEIDKKKYLLSGCDGILKIENQKVKPFYINREYKEYISMIEHQDKFFVVHKNGVIEIDKKAQQLGYYSFPNSISINKVQAVISTLSGPVFLTDQENYILSSGRLITLDKFFKTRAVFNRYSFGHNSRDGLVFFNSKLTQTIHANLADKSYKELLTSFSIEEDERITEMDYNPYSNHRVFLSENGNIIHSKGIGFKRFYNNSTVTKDFCSIFEDQYGNFWLGNKTNGLFNAHFALFNKMNYAEIYRNSHIYFTHQINEKEIIFSSINPDKTYIGHLFDPYFKEYDFRIFDKVTSTNTTLFATSKGIYSLSPDQNIKLISNSPLIVNHSFNSISEYEKGFIAFSNGTDPIFISKDLSIISKIELPEELSNQFVNTTYYNPRQNHLFLGTKNGVFRWDPTYKTFRNLTAKLNVGNSANVTNDIYGTTWFTTEIGLYGIHPFKGELTLTDTSIFKNVIFNNIQADTYGQLLIGTTRGLLILKLNNDGKIITHSYFDSSNGFEGYNTHPHSSSILNNLVLLGTGDGIFCVDFKYHNTKFTPNPPLLISKTINNNELTFNVVSMHPQFKEIYYSYKIEGIDETWSTPTSNTSFTIRNLPTGKTSLLLRCTYDNVQFSNISSELINIHYNPISNSIILYIALILGLIGNIFVYNRIRKKNTSQDFYKEDFFVLQNLSPYLILFGGIINFLSHLIANVYLNNIFYNVTILITGLFINLTLFFIASRIKEDEKRFTKTKQVLILAFLVILAQNEYFLFQSDLHPFLCIGIITVVNFAPFIFDKTLNIIIFAISLFLLNLLIVFGIDAPLYNPTMFIISIATSCLAILLLNSIRHQSISRLAFNSALINRSDIYIISIDAKGLVTYVSKNFVRLLSINEIQVLGEKVDFLKMFIPIGFETGFLDYPSAFEEEKNYAFPIKLQDNRIIWLSWKMKHLEKNVFALIGNDITEKVALQNTYEIMVENAQDLIYQVNSKGEFVFLNNKFNDYLLQEKSLYIGKKLIEIVHPDFQEEVFKFYADQIKRKEKISYLEFPIIDKFDQENWIGQYVTLLFEPGYENKVTGFFALGRDITDKRTKEELISSQNSRIQDSILYAKRIQNNLLKSGNRFKENFDDHFVMYEPKDTVSGDFYWSVKINGQIVLAVGDCTGHGVPGAFMSILVINLLNSIVTHTLITDPGRIMNELDSRLKSILNTQEDVSFRDGVELTLCVFDEVEPILQYCCAGSKFLIHNGSSFDIVRGETKHIGDVQDHFSSYVTHNIILNNRSTLYLFTDGFQDQFGGVHNKKFSFRRLVEMFTENINLPLTHQGKSFEEEFISWKGSETQTDDITIIGIRPFKIKIDD